MARRIQRGYVIAESEAAFQTAVIQYARHNGWRVWAPPPNRPGKSGRVPAIIGVVGGWPDLAMWRAPPAVIIDVWNDPPAPTRLGEFLLAELKSAKGRLRQDQIDTIAELGACGVEIHIWRPADWPAIEQRLKRTWLDPL